MTTDEITPQILRQACKVTGATEVLEGDAIVVEIGNAFPIEVRGDDGGCVGFTAKGAVETALGMILAVLKWDDGHRSEFQRRQNEEIAAAAELLKRNGFSVERRR